MAKIELTEEQEKFAWKLAKILKHGYTNFENQNQCSNAILFLIQNGVALKKTEYYQEADTKDFIIEPTKANVKKIAKILDKQFGIGLLDPCFM